MPSTPRPYSSAVWIRWLCRCTVPLGVPVDPLEYSQKQASSAQVLATCGAVAPPRTSAATEFGARRRPRTTVLSVPIVPINGSKAGSKRLGDEQGLRARIAQHELEILGGQQRVRGDRDHAGQDAAEEDHRPFERVEHRDHHARFGREAAGAQRVGEAMRLVGQLAIGELRAGRGIDEGDLAGARRRCARAGRAPRCSPAGSRPGAGWHCGRRG